MIELADWGNCQHHEQTVLPSAIILRLASIGITMSLCNRHLDRRLWVYIYKLVPQDERRSRNNNADGIITSRAGSLLYWIPFLL